MQALVALMISAGDQGPGHTRIALPWAFQSASTPHRLMPSAPTAMPYTPLSPQGFKAYCTGSCILHHTTYTKPHTTTPRRLSITASSSASISVKVFSGRP